MSTFMLLLSLQFEEYVKGRMADSSTGFGIEFGESRQDRKGQICSPQISFSASLIGVGGGRRVRGYCVVTKAYK
jgi:hypothetical protein